MKKKIIYGFLMMALTVSTMGSFVSCKDYDEDMYVDLRGRITDETSAREALELQVKELQSIVSGLNSCKCDLSQYLKIADADNKYATIANLNAAITLLQGSIDDAEAKLGQIDPNNNV